MTLSKEEIIEKLEQYLREVKPMAEWKEKTGARYYGLFKSFLDRLDGFNKENNINFDIPELEYKEEVNFFDIKPFEDRLDKFLKDIKSGEVSIYRS